MGLWIKARPSYRLVAMWRWGVRRSTFLFLRWLDAILWHLSPWIMMAGLVGWMCMLKERHQFKRPVSGAVNSWWRRPLLGTAGISKKKKRFAAYLQRVSEDYQRRLIATCRRPRYNNQPTRALASTPIAVWICTTKWSIHHSTNKIAILTNSVANKLANQPNILW